MSLKSLLAVGESFSATTSAPSPYAVRKEHQLPVFGEAPPADRPNAELNIQTEEVKPQAEMNFEARMKMGPERRAIEPEPEERRRLLGRWPRGGAKNFTQPELRLENVKPLRNDLSDSDLELAPRRSARSVEPDINPFSPRPIAAMGHPTHEKTSWPARLARLLGLRRRGRP
jgi:hypothetical protein